MLTRLSCLLPGRHRALVQTGLCAALLLVAACKPAPEPAVPANLDRLDPAVVALVRDQVEIIKAQPRDAAGHGELGLMYSANALWADSRRAFATAVALTPANYVWRYYLAVATLQVGETSNALTQFQSLAIEDPDFAPVQNRLGELLLQSGDLRAATEAFKRVVALEPAAPMGYAGLGEVLINGGHYAEAARVLEKAIDQDLRYEAAHYLLGIAYRNTGRAQEAARELSRGAQATKRHFAGPFYDRQKRYKVNRAAQVRKGVELMKSGRPAAGGEIFATLLKDDPENVSLLNNYAVALMNQNRLHEAQQVLERAVAANAGKFTTHNNLASLALQRQDLAQALKFASQAVAVAPENHKTQYLRGWILLGLGRFDEAADSLTQSARLSPSHVDSHVFLGEALLQSERVAQARAEFLVVLGLEPNHLLAHAGMVRAGLADGQLDQAETHLKILGRLAPDSPQVQQFRKALDDARG